MGQKNQLWWDLPAGDSFELLREIYLIPPGEFRATLGELTELLGVEKLTRQAVRELSLGERMKMELIAAFCTGRGCCCSMSRRSGWTSWRRE